MVQGTCFGAPLLVFSLICFSFCTSSPMNGSFAWVGVGGFSLCALIYFLSSVFSLVFPFCLSFLALMRADTAVSGLGVCLINIYLNLFIRQLPKFHHCGVVAHRRQRKIQKGKENEKSEEKERDLGTVGERPNSIPDC